MLTRVADIYGYTPSSSQTSAETTNEEGEGTGEYEVGGAITVIPNYKRQYCPSEAYSEVNFLQTYITYKESNIGTVSDTKGIIENHDARYGRSIQGDYSYEGVTYPLCSKAARNIEFFYAIPVYRKTLVWLRLAEAINRAGYPEFAFAILKDGLNQYTLPAIKTLSTATNNVYTINGTTYNKKIHSDSGIEVYVTPEDPRTGFYYDENGDFVQYTSAVGGTKWQYEQTIDYYRQLTYNTYQPMYYMTDTLRLNRFNQWLNFKDDVWNSTYGIHARGAGIMKTDPDGKNALWQSTNNGQVMTNIYGKLDSVYYDYTTLLQSHGLSAIPAPTLADTIDAVENIIVDELALETAFEGNRFTDLVRIAEHKNASGKQGTQWLATKIANRGTRKAFPSNPAVEGYDATLFTKLLNQQNWYFELPKW